MQDYTAQNEQRNASPHGAAWRYAALACMLLCVFCLATPQLAPPCQKQPVPRQNEEETHESVGKLANAVASARRKVPQSHAQSGAGAGERRALPRVGGMTSEIIPRWNAHSYRRRGPPSSPLSA